MDRRTFLRTMIGGLAAGAAVRTFPFRVFSFPSEIVKPPTLLGPVIDYLLSLQEPFGEDMKRSLKHASANGLGDIIVQPEWDYYEVAANTKIIGIPLFNSPLVTDHESRITEI
jgi:hypothetical protein